MATIYPSYNPIPSTPSASSQSSLPPSYAIPVHDHILPPGWQCKYDPKTSKYYFLNDHLQQQWESLWKGHGSCHSSRSSSPSHSYSPFGRYFQPISARYRANDPLVQRIWKMFPEVEESYITNLLRIHQNRENQVINILLSEGYSKSYRTLPDEALFYKLKSYFPSVDPETIRQLLVKHNNSEHEVIAGIITSLGPSFRSYSKLGSSKMKLRYIKVIYPEVDETILFDLLHNCGHNAQEVIQRLEKMGYKKKDLLKPVPAKSDSISTTDTKVIRPKTIFKQIAFPPNLTERQLAFERLQSSFPKVDRVLINMALECANYNEERACLFLSAMTPQDSEKYIPKEFASKECPLITLHCKAIQTDAFIDTVPGTPINLRKSQPEKVASIGTSTTEDGIFVEEKKKPLAKGPNPSNKKGSNILNLLKSYIPWRGSDSKNRQGPDASKQKGPELNNKTGPTVKAKGSDTKNRKGPCSIFLRKKRKSE